MVGQVDKCRRTIERLLDYHIHSTLYLHTRTHARTSEDAISTCTAEAFIAGRLDCCNSLLHAERAESGAV